MEHYNNFSKEVQEILEKAFSYSVGDETYKANTDELLEFLLDEDIIYRKIGSAHRWYDEELFVVNIDGNFIGYQGFHLTGDNSASDMGLQYNLSYVKLYEQREIKAIEYHPKSE